MVGLTLTLDQGQFSTYGIKVIVDPVERSGALQQLMCARVVNTKLCHILSTAAHRPTWRVGGLQRLHSAE